MSSRLPNYNLPYLIAAIALCVAVVSASVYVYTHPLQTPPTHYPYSTTYTFSGRLESLTYDQHGSFNSVSATTLKLYNSTAAEYREFTVDGYQVYQVGLNYTVTYCVTTNRFTVQTEVLSVREMTT